MTHTAQTIPSLREYLLIEQGERGVEIYRRARDWATERLIEGGVQLDCLDVELPLDVIYEDVRLGQ